jgi:protein SCO1/2
MTRPARRTLLLSIVVVAGVLSLAARLLLARSIALPELGELPDFQLTDERGATLTRAHLRGHVTIVDFVFTSCATACPLLSSEMARLQAMLRNDGLAQRVQLLSISVDPARDTPERLRAFAARYEADPALWRFARGDEAAIRHVVVEGMKQEVARQIDRGEVDGFTILHGTKLVLVDDRLRIRGYYDAKDVDSMHQLRGDLTALADGRVELKPEIAPPPGAP